MVGKDPARARAPHQPLVGRRPLRDGARSDHLAHSVRRRRVRDRVRLHRPYAHDRGERRPAAHDRRSGRARWPIFSTSSGARSTTCTSACTSGRCRSRCRSRFDSARIAFTRPTTRTPRTNGGARCCRSIPCCRNFARGFIGKSSPVHFWWGGFDLAVTRFSGRRAPERPGADAITREGYSHEVISAGFWPGSGAIAEPAFYAYAAPEPAGFKDALVEPAAAFYSADFNEFMLKYDDVRRAASPRDALLQFLQTTYDAGAALGSWNRAELERPATRAAGRATQ